MFANYVADGPRRSPVNLAVARLVLGVWVTWKTVWYNWPQHVEAPYRLMAAPPHEWGIPMAAPRILVVEQWLLIGLVWLFVLGYRIRLTGTVSAVLLAHLGVVRETLVNSGEVGSLFLGSLFILFFALYAEMDCLSVDGFRSTRTQSVTALADRLQSGPTRTFRMPALRYALLTLALLFFSTGASKVVAGNGLGFVAPDNLTRLLLVRSYIYPWHDVQLLLVDYPIIGVLGGIGTLALELGFIIAVISGIGFVAMSVGLVAFTLSNAVLLGILFVDNLFFVALFLAYDRAFERLATDREIDLVFDEQCHFCVRSLYPFSLLDVADTVSFISQTKAPEDYRARDGVDFGRSMYVFDGQNSYEGYDAFQELFRMNRTFLPIVWVMGLEPVRGVGQRVYRYVADNRSQHFTCRPEDAESVDGL